MCFGAECSFEKQGSGLANLCAQKEAGKKRGEAGKKRGRSGEETERSGEETGKKRGCFLPI